MQKDSWGTVKLPNGQRKEVRREGDKVHVRDPGTEIHTTVPLNDFLGALVIEMDRKMQRPIEGVHLVEAIKLSDNPLQWKSMALIFGILSVTALIANIASFFE
jgi:hypothetical protein